MEEIAEYTDITAGRENMYRLLSLLYKTEVDENSFRYIRETDFPESGDSEISEGFKIIKNSLATPSTDPLTDLAVDYAKVFLGAGAIDTSSAAYPYESVYTSPGRLIMQDARDNMYRTLLKNKMALNSSYNIPEDHIFVQLEFMAFLCIGIREAITGGNMELASQLLNSQKQFIEEHILNWIPEFCSDVTRHASTGFYKGLAKVTESFIKADLEVIQDMISSYSA